jgi:hypothetical protein
LRRTRWLMAVARIIVAFLVALSVALLPTATLACLKSPDMATVMPKGDSESPPSNPAKAPDVCPFAAVCAVTVCDMSGSAISGELWPPLGFTIAFARDSEDLPSHLVRPPLPPPRV